MLYVILSVLAFVAGGLIVFYVLMGVAGDLIKAFWEGWK